MTLIPSEATNLLVRARAYLARMRVVPTVKCIAGMPDYDAYVEHLRATHPDCAIPSEREYYDLYLRGRYDGNATRCC